MKQYTLHQFYIYGWILLLSFYSCQSDQIYDDSSNPEKATEVTFTLEMPIQSDAPTLRALAATNENHLSEVDILVFNTSGNGGGFVMRSYGRNIVDVNNQIDMKRFSAKIQPGTYDLLILANCRKYIDEMITTHYPTGIPATTTLASIQSNLVFSVAGKWDPKPASATYQSIPMWGTGLNATITNNTNITGIKMLRALAKININVDTSIRNNFKLKTVSLYNRATSGTIIPEPANFDPQLEVVTKAILPSGYTAATVPITYNQTDLDAPAIIDTAIINTIYIPETPAGTSTTLTANPCIIIEGTYVPHGQDYFYRIDYMNEVNNVKDYIELLRNFQYNITITNVRGGGNNTAQEAIESPSNNIDTHILKCESGQLGKVVWNGEYYLSVAPDSLTFSRAARTASSIDNKLIIKTNYTTGWSISPSSIVDEQGNVITWLRIDPLEQSGGTNVSDPISLLADENSTSQTRTAYMTVKGGLIEITVKVIQHPWQITDAQITADDVIPANEHLATFTLQGVFPNTPVRIWDITNNQSIVQETVAGSTTTSQVQLQIPLYWSSTISQPQNISIAFQYLHPLSGQWVTIDTRLRKSYYVQTQSTLTNGYAIPNTGETFTTSFWGNYPDLYIRLWDGSTIIGTEQKIDASTDIQSVSLMSGVNTGTSRTVSIQYSRDNRTSWTSIVSGTQVGGTGHYKLSTGRYVANENASFSGGQLWASAMGIDSRYDEESFYTSYGAGNAPDNTAYTPTRATGCNAYSEPGYPQGIWRVPTRAELVEMLANINQLPNFPDYGNMISEAYVTYWSSTEIEGWDSFAYSLMIYPGSTRTPSLAGKDFSRYNLRCVRGEHP